MTDKKPLSFDKDNDFALVMASISIAKRLCNDPLSNQVVVQAMEKANSLDGDMFTNTVRSLVEEDTYPLSESFLQEDEPNSTYMQMIEEEEVDEGLLDEEEVQEKSEQEEDDEEDAKKASQVKSKKDKPKKGSDKELTEEELLDETDYEIDNE